MDQLFKFLTENEAQNCSRISKFFGILISTKLEITNFQKYVLTFFRILFDAIEKCL